MLSLFDTAISVVLKFPGHDKKYTMKRCHGLKNFGNSLLSPLFVAEFFKFNTWSLAEFRHCFGEHKQNNLDSSPNLSLQFIQSSFETH